ncbi:MAG TPA: (d)CMP kinase [Acidimicrobiia bacterium]|nr:(d)CMP kinase [Acidimicrobiia bacterium]
MSVLPVVAIDGPSGSGKSTVGRGVARALGLEVLDTGAMYRAVTLAALEAGVDLSDAGALAALAERSSIEPGDRVLLDGRDVTVAIRGPEVTATVSTVSAHPPVRAELVARQRAWVDRHGGGVVEGRDIGTVVFPDAPVKVFLTASEQERARRRQRDEAAAERVVDVDAVQADIARRDAIDAARAASPMAIADDALVIDTTGRPVDGIVAEIVERFRRATSRARAR